MEENDVIISLRHVQKKFEDDFMAVSDFDLDIRKGEFVTLLGPSGCGKSTTLRMIAGFDIPTSGSILLNNEDITKLPPYKRPINTVFQHYALFPNLDVYDNIAFGLKLKKVPVEVKNRKGETKVKMKKLSNKAIDQKVAKALSIVDMEEMEDRQISNLSGGQQQRVAIARAIVNEPKVLLLDEPLSALDHKKRIEMQLELKEMHKKLGITFIYVTHDQEEALTMSDTIVVMRDGEIVQVGTPEQIYNEPKSAYVADFIGESNIYNATVVGEKKVRFLSAVFNCVDDFPLNEKVDVAIRPEDIILSNAEDGIVSGVITETVFKGEDYSYTIKIGKKSEVSCRSHDKHEIGEKVGVSVLPENIQVMEKDLNENSWDDAYINDLNQVVIGDDAFECDVTQLIKGSVLDEEGYLIDTKANKKYNLKNAPVKVTCSLDAPKLSDNLEEGEAHGVIIEALWKGDHYRDIVRTEEEEDFVINTQYEWNEGDQVSVSIEKSAFKLALKKEIGEYEVE